MNGLESKMYEEISDFYFKKWKNNTNLSTNFKTLLAVRISSVRFWNLIYSIMHFNTESGRWPLARQPLSPRIYSGSHPRFQHPSQRKWMIWWHPLFQIFLLYQLCGDIDRHQVAYQSWWQCWPSQYRYLYRWDRLQHRFCTYFAWSPRRSTEPSLVSCLYGEQQMGKPPS